MNNTTFIIAVTIVAVIVFIWILTTLIANADAEWAEQVIELQRFVDANYANMTQGK